ncbi:hypothetical protein Bhyg_04771 [Pseudolycoriella hygida]|uniref:Uncharacterized protein n=1 Tax=Pseudolycoriella hygida TaxID=35572 RepID=A0A9Q0SAA3_9DIPT|nr:hypothetical protein Bhyg_04771 [Pseudolycoriella hygida]
MTKFSIDGSYDKKTDLELLELLGSVESLVTLELTMPDVSHVLRGIERFKSLKTLEIYGDDIVDISSLAQLRSNCSVLEVCCRMLAQPNPLVDVVRNLKKLKKIELACQVALSEAACADLAKKFAVDEGYDKETDLQILKHLGSVESLETLQLRMPDVSHMLTGIERFKSLTKLEIIGYDIVDISSLAQLRSNCTNLYVRCTMLAVPNSLVDVVRNLKKLETIKLYCRVAFSKADCADLAKVCSSQDRLWAAIVVS